ncbi:MAG: hypothetical protein AB1643_01040 [Patescibacteria group bacterium]
MQKNILIIFFSILLLIVFSFFFQNQAKGQGFSLPNLNISLPPSDQISSPDEVKNFALDLKPKYPGPNQEVNVSAKSYSFDIDRAVITWSINGIQKLKGVGEKNFTFRTGDVGSKTTINIIVVSLDGLKLENNLIIIPADVDILWEAENYIPPTYKGKALPTSISKIKISALPNVVIDDVKFSPSKLIYNWEINGKKKIDISGYGKNSFSFKSSAMIGQDNIKLTMTDYNKKILVEKRVLINIVQPKIIFYEKNPLAGIKYNLALSDKIDLGGGEMSIKAEPYFFSLSDLDQLFYQWNMNNKDINMENDPAILNLRTPEGGSGYSFINLRVKNPLSILQFADKSLTINFGR